MIDETKKLFDAPWFPFSRACDFHGLKRNNGSEIFSDASLRSEVNRLARLPELYEALLRSVCTSCNACIYDHCGSPVECEQLLSQDCTYEDSKLCFEHEARELLRKVRDGR